MTLDDEQFAHGVVRSDQIDRVGRRHLSGGLETHPIDVGDAAPCEREDRERNVPRTDRDDGRVRCPPPSRQPTAAPQQHHGSRRRPPSSGCRAASSVSLDVVARVSVASFMIATY